MRSENIFLTGKKSFCKEAGENKEVILSIWASQGNKNSPGYIVCNLQVDGRIIHRFYCRKKKTRAKPRIIQFRTHNLITVLMIVLFPSVYGPCFWLQVGAPLVFVYYQKGENLAKSGSSARHVLESAHKFYSIRFFIGVSTFELSLIRF